jgi:hypothetical protein
MYINDINNCTHLSILSFADDTTVYMSHKNLNELYNIANEELVKLNDWLCANKLALNIKKLNMQYLGHKSNVINLQMSLLYP